MEFFIHMRRHKMWIICRKVHIFTGCLFVVRVSSVPLLGFFLNLLLLSFIKVKRPIEQFQKDTLGKMLGKDIGLRFSYYSLVVV